jgi:FAD/FMN-containing dehydrogenase
VNAYALRKARLLADLAAGNVGVGLAKDTSNLFRDRAPRPRPRIDLSPFDTVLKVDPAAGTVEAEGMVKFVDLVDATLPHGTMPAVVPQLKSITLGGAVAGVGIEASSFRHGLVHENIVAMDVLTGDGRIVTCTPDNEHAALFHGMPNSYGTLGYALKLTMRTMPVQSFVTLAHRRFGSADTFLRAMTAGLADRSIAFLDGVAFAPDELVLTEGRLVDAAPYASDYTYERIYYRSLRERTVDFLTVRDFLWRWDTDWFWCSRNVGAQHPWLRRLLGRRRLNSVTYQRIMRWNSRTGLAAAWERARGLHGESVIQDVDIPLAHAAAFLAFLHAEVGILPIWICPIRAPTVAGLYPLYPLAPGTPHVNFGFWDRVTSREARPRGFMNRRIEAQVRSLGGLKSLYSDAYFTDDEFWSIYNRPAYEALKAAYDPERRLPDLYAKCVLRR